jgi:hypothetical protein
MNTLTVEEKRTLKQCENVIETGVRTFVEIGNALVEIRDKRLYKETHSDFRVYCKDRWGFEKSRAYQLIGAAKVSENVHHGGQTPDNERQTRELAKLPNNQQAEAWNEVVERTEGKPTAAAVAEVVEEYLDSEDSTAEEEDEYTAPEPSHGFTNADIKDAYKDCKALAKVMLAEPSKENLSALLSMVLELWGVTENRCVFQSKMENLITTL